MSEQTQVNVPNAELPLKVMTKDPKKVVAGKKLTEFNCRKKKSWPRRLKLNKSKPKISYGIGAVITVGVLGLLGWYIYQRGSPGDNNTIR